MVANVDSSTLDCFDAALAAGRRIGIPAFEARLLLAHAASVSREWLTAHGADAITQELAVRYLRLVERRREGVPIAYLIGEREFFGRMFIVDDAVLIPRPETELLVQFALDRTPLHGRVLDLGTGSGAIAVSIAAERADLDVVAVDRSRDALTVAAANAARHACANLRCVASNWMSAFAGQRFSTIVANPPYIARRDAHLEQGDLRFEPRAALTDESDGLECLRVIIADAPLHLHEQGWLAVEHGHDQADAVRAWFTAHGFGQVASMRDLADIERMTFGQRSNR